MVAIVAHWILLTTHARTHAPRVYTERPSADRSVVSFAFYTTARYHHRE